ncbi:zinc finger protein [Macleaya cordata]|uniref:Zinc finger protein n=1 Tax=Macleaya cordata TaxID=56857 RepID=A0A200QGB0_MACCD|nr:zinc finger protein [Macleaya cordata]
MAMVAERNELGFPYWNPVRRRFEPDAPFFASGNLERELLAKQVALDLTEDERYQLQSMEDEEERALYCPIVGCGARLNSLEDFEGHYHARHTASCSVCSRVFPTSRLLSIHVSEAHDSFFQAKVARGYPMYECLVEGCGMKLKSYKSRQQHLVDKHKFPTSFEFFKKAQPSKKQRQKKPHKQKLADNKAKRENTDTGMDVDETIDGLVSAVSKLSTSDSSPSSVSFGRRRTQVFTFVPRAVVRDRKQNSSVEGSEG